MKKTRIESSLFSVLFSLLFLGKETLWRPQLVFLINKTCNNSSIYIVRCIIMQRPTYEYKQDIKYVPNKQDRIPYCSAYSAYSKEAKAGKIKHLKGYAHRDGMARDFNFKPMDIQTYRYTTWIAMLWNENMEKSCHAVATYVNPYCRLPFWYLVFNLSLVEGTWRDFRNIICSTYLFLGV